MHRLSSSFVLAYHGCDQEVAERLLRGEPFKKSENTYDWLGSGVYFWEANPQRGLDFATEAARRPRSVIKTPTVIGAVVDLGLCLDMATLSAARMVEQAHASLKATLSKAGQDLPRNHDSLLLRPLDCAVINWLHQRLREDGAATFDTVRGIFVEGPPLYPNAGFRAKTHVQIAVRNADCIKGVFRVPEVQLEHHPTGVKRGSIR